MLRGNNVPINVLLILPSSVKVGKKLGPLNNKTDLLRENQILSFGYNSKIAARTVLCTGITFADVQHKKNNKV